MVIFYLASAFHSVKDPIHRVVQHIPLNSVLLCICSVFDSRGVSMARITFVFLCVLLLHVLSLGTCEETPCIFIVLMDTSLMPQTFISPHHWYQNTLSLASETSVAPEMLYTYTAIGGFSAVLTSSQHKKIKNSHGYITSLKDKRRAKFLTTHSSDFLGLNSFSGAWPQSNYGKGVIIGVLDTGIWPESMSFSDRGMDQVTSRWRGGCHAGKNFSSSLCNKKLIGARFFLKGAKAENPDTGIEDSARDVNGHGTHVISTAAGNYIHRASYFGYGSGTARGVAPRAHVAMYRIGTVMFISDSDILAGIDQAIADGVDILSLSFRADSPIHLHEDVIAIGTFAATKKGIFVSRAAGNDGPELWTISLAGAAPWEMTVGAGSQDREFAGTVRLGNGVSIVGSSFYGLKTITDNLPMVFSETCSFQMLGKIVLCEAEQTDGDPADAADRFIGTGVAGAIIIWPTPDIYMEHFSFPAIFISRANGEVILEYIRRNSKPQATLMFQQTIHGHTRPAPRVADFSSSGPSLSCPSISKPDILAPGVNILASWKGTFEFEVLSGTSMAAPHAAGVAALLKGAHPDWSPAAIRSAIMTTADALDNSLIPIQRMNSYGLWASPLDMGAGHVNPNNAMDPGLVYDAGEEEYINYLCAANFTWTQIRAIVRSNLTCATPAVDLNYPSFLVDLDCIGTKSMLYHRTVTNVGEGRSSYSVRFEHIDGLKISVEPEVLTFNHRHEKRDYKLKVEGKCLEKGTVLHGSVSWVEIGGGRRVVRSTIVAKSLTPPAI